MVNKVQRDLIPKYLSSFFSVTLHFWTDSKVEKKITVNIHWLIAWILPLTFYICSIICLSIYPFLSPNTNLSWFGPFQSKLQASVSLSPLFLLFPTLSPRQIFSHSLNLSDYFISLHFGPTVPSTWNVFSSCSFLTYPLLFSLHFVWGSPWASI